MIFDYSNLFLEDHQIFGVVILCRCDAHTSEIKQASKEFSCLAYIMILPGSTLRSISPHLLHFCQFFFSKKHQFLFIFLCSVSVIE